MAILFFETLKTQQRILLKIEILDLPMYNIEMFQIHKNA